MIDTTSGAVAVEDLQPGALLTTPDGPPLQLLVNIRAKGDWVSPSALLPVVIRKEAFGPNCPNHPLMVSQQHGIVVIGSRLELQHGMKAALVPAVGLVDFDAVTIGHNLGAIQFYHLLCDRHGVVYANGVAAETFLWSADRREGFDVGVAFGQDAELKPQSCCLPRLSVRETRTLMRGSNMQRPVIGANNVCSA